ncbi:hypothetical protein [Corynebacterium bouchesdurhonense]|uniref:hypothetical protein n=1 Tax=Corynebacterium bouchesdurhonense TaxID=1720192 RepID=UPI00082A9028|nr:hypothetical protein [Corynebacterium bouchesdurhonense]
MNHQAVTYRVAWDETKRNRIDEVRTLKEAQDAARRISTASNVQNVRIEKITRTVTTEEVTNSAEVEGA